MIRADLFVRRMFASHVARMLTVDDQYGWALLSLAEGPDETYMVLVTERPILSSDGKRAYGSRRVTISISADFEEQL